MRDKDGMNNSEKKEFLEKAALQSFKSVSDGGGPFGAVIVKGGEVIAQAGNTVTRDNDPTAHAEINAIRKAAKKLDSFDLSDCEIYCSCEPCPMCLGAIYWAKMDKIYYANTSETAKKYGFDDSLIYEECSRNMEQRRIHFEHFDVDSALEAFKAWQKKQDKIEY